MDVLYFLCQILLLLGSIMNMYNADDGKHGRSTKQNPLRLPRRSKSRTVNTNAHENAKRMNEQLVCAGVLDDPNNTTKTYHLRSITFNNKERVCCPCNPGERLYALCLQGPNKQNTTDCRECEDGTYMPHYSHTYAECFNDTLKCPENEIYIPSTKTTAPKCLCLEGFHRGHHGLCVAHSPCEKGKGVKIRGTPFHNTVCETCPHGFVSPTLSPTESCHYNQSLFRLTNNLYLQPTTPTPYIKPTKVPFSHNTSDHESPECSTVSPDPRGTEVDETVKKCKDSYCEGWMFLFWIFGIATAAVVDLLIRYCCCKKVNTTSCWRPSRSRGLIPASSHESVCDFGQSKTQEAASPMLSSQNGEPPMSPEEQQKVENNKLLLIKSCEFFEANSKSCQLLLTNDQVARFCHIRDFNPPPSQEFPLLRMAEAIQRGLDLDKIHYFRDLSPFLQNNNLRRIDEELRNHLWPLLKEIMM